VGFPGAPGSISSLGGKTVGVSAAATGNAAREDTKRGLRRLLPPVSNRTPPSTCSPPEPAIAGPRPSSQGYARYRLAATRAHRQRVKARTHPIRRVVVRWPAWRAWRSLLSTKRKSMVLSRQCSNASSFATGASARWRRSISKSIARTLSRIGSLTPARIVSRAPSARHNANSRVRAANQSKGGQGRGTSPHSRRAP